MPILAAEPDIFPDDLLSEKAVRDDVANSWWAIYTLSRREKELMRRLRSQEIAHYCPLVEKKSRSPSGRMRSSFLPLFASYVFVFGPREARLAAQATNCVARWLEVDDRAAFEADLRQIKALIQSGLPVTLESKLQPGDLVRIRHGALSGMEGVILRREQKLRLVVAVNFLQQGASIEVDEMNLEPML